MDRERQVGAEFGIMPKWGLTVDQRASGPWKLSADLLGPGKTITDPVHGDIYLTRLETQVVNSAPMQRLRRVRQLGTTYLVYPGAIHKRSKLAARKCKFAERALVDESFLSIDNAIKLPTRPRPTLRASTPPPPCHQALD